MSPFLTTLGGGSVRGFGRAFRRIIAGPVQGQQAYTTAGTYTFVVPAGVTSISAVCVSGGGGPNIRNGGRLSYSNSVATTAGESLTIVVGAQEVASSISRSATTLIIAQGPGAGGNTPGIGDVVNLGGLAGTQGSGGGAAGYSGSYAQAGNQGGYGAGGENGVQATAGNGGGGGGGGEAGSTYIVEGSCSNPPRTDSSGPDGAGGGGGVGILGMGSSGAGGARGGGFTGGSGGGGGGGGGSGGANGGTGAVWGNGGAGGAFGGAGGNAGYYNVYPFDCGEGAPDPYGGGSGTAGAGAGGAVRIIWGAGRSYPSNAANV
jgi:hypothetical protein